MPLAVPLQGTALYMLGVQLNALPPGAAGAVYIGGAGGKRRLRGDDRFAHWLSACAAQQSFFAHGFARTN